MDRDGSGEIALSEFVASQEASKKGDRKQRKESTAIQAFRKTDVNGDGRIDWTELVSAMYQKYGRAAVADMLKWDLSEIATEHGSLYSRAGAGVKLSESQIADVKLMFDVYDVDKEGQLTIEDLAASMADFHGLKDSDLLAILTDNLGKTFDDLVDADDYVDIFRHLIAGDEGIIDILHKTKRESYDERASSALPRLFGGSGSPSSSSSPKWGRGVGSRSATPEAS
mmetsp:Transcript_29727/g.90994  ORF Transcript_29727/g.90994 Transcript_29727/m.90994 type:complete len:226 (+) Transcript_29727:474-1151(+)